MVGTNENGITLIALIITIVILIILAVVSINIGFGEGGLMDSAEDAKKLTEEGEIEQEKQLNSMVELLYSQPIENMINSGKGLTILFCKRCKKILE